MIEQYESLDTFKIEMRRNMARKLFYYVAMKQAKAEGGVQATATMVMAALFDEHNIEKVMLIESQIAEGLLTSQTDADDFNAEVKAFTDEVIAGVQKDNPAMSGRIFKGSVRVV